MDLEIDFPKRPPKRIRAQNLLFGPECGAPAAREPPISLPSHSRFERVCLAPERTRAKKIDTEARPSPGTARRCTGAFRVGRVPLHQHDSEIGRFGSQFARNRAWSGRGAPHSPGFSFWGSENIFIHMMHNRVGKYSEGSKKSSRAAFRPEYSRGAEYALLWPQKISSTTGGQRSCPARAFRRLHIPGLQNAQLGPECGGKITPGLVSSGVSSPSSPFSMTRQLGTSCIIIKNNARKCLECVGRAFPSRSVTPLIIMGWSREAQVGLTWVSLE